VGRVRMRRFLMIAAIVAAICIALVAIARHPFLLRHHKDLVEKRLSRLLGFAVAVEGPIAMRVLPWPWVDLKDVHMRAADGDSKSEALYARDISVRLDLWPLLSGKWSIRRLKVTDAELCVSAREGSPCDWRRALDAIDEVTTLDHVTIRRMKVSCHGGFCGKTLDEKVALITASLPAHGATKVSIYAEDEREPLAELSAGTWSDFRANRPWRTKGSLQWRGMHLAMAGTIREPRELRGVDLDVDGRAQLGRWHGVSLGEPRIRGHLVEGKDGYQLDIDRSEWGTGKIIGRVKAARSNDGLQIDGTVAAKGMDLDPWMDKPTEGRASGGYADATATFTTSGNTVDDWFAHLRGSARVDAGPAELPIDQVERWSQGLLKFVFSLPAEGALTHIHCMGGQFNLRDGRASTSDLRIDTETTRMRGIGSLYLPKGEMDLLIKPTLKHGPLKDAPLVQVSGDIERPVARLAGEEVKAESKTVFAQLPDKPADTENPCR
jgi:AsmA-like C-terminal region/AsmA family